MLLGTATNTLKCLWALRITFCGDNWKRLTGYLFTLRSRGAYLSVASVYNGAYQSHTRDTKRSIEGAKAGWDQEAIDILTASEA